MEITRVASPSKSQEQASTPCKGDDDSCVQKLEKCSSSHARKDMGKNLSKLISYFDIRLEYRIRNENCESCT